MVRKSAEIINNVKKYLERKNFYKYLDSATISENFQKELSVVASKNNKRNIQLKDSWAEIKTLGDKRTILVVELGGSYLHLIKVEVQEKQTVRILNSVSIDFYDKTKIYTPEKLFSDIYKHLNGFISPEEKETIEDCVFIFTFPIEQFRRKDGCIDAIAVKINKHIKHEGIIGMHVGEEMEKYGRLNGFKNIKVSVTNDTIPTLLATKYFEITEKTNYDAALIIIVGTGTNIAFGYDKKTENGSGYYMVNTEFAYFNSFPMSDFDTLFEKDNPAQGESMTEKKISGLWQPFLFKTMIEEMVADKILPAEYSKVISEIKMSGREVEYLLKNKKLELSMHDVLDFIWLEQTRRGAFIAGLAIANCMKYVLDKTVVKKLNFGMVEVGSVIKNARVFNDHMHKSIKAELTRLDCGDKISYTVIKTDHTSTKGAIIFNSIIRNHL